MAEIVNLRRARKRRARRAAEETAEANRQRSGLSKAARAEAAAERDQALRALDGHRLDEDRAPDA